LTGKETEMAEKRKTVEPKKKPVVYCQHCRNRMHGMESVREGKSGYCPIIQEHVKRKDTRAGTCKGFKSVKETA